MSNFKEIGNIFILTGAGISKESGLDTFRDQDGLWANHHVDEVGASGEETGLRGGLCLDCFIDCGGARELELLHSGTPEVGGS